PLAERPQLAQQRPGFAVREPVVPRLLAKVERELGLERPRTQVLAHVEARVDVREPVGRAGLDLEGVPEQLDVARPERQRVVGAAHRLHHEYDAAWHLDRRAERTRRLLLA